MTAALQHGSWQWVQSIEIIGLLIVRGMKSHDKTQMSGHSPLSALSSRQK
jgi:hypothetical protein